MTYVAGFVNTTIVGDINAGVQTLTVADATGITSGMILPIEDSVNSENITVESVSGNVITLTTPTSNPHADGAGVSLIPQAVKLATVRDCKFPAESTHGWRS